MSSPLYLVRARMDPVRLAEYAARTGTLDDDLGYALHLALRRRFGEAAPQPFRRMPGPDADRDWLLGYARDPAALTAGADLGTVRTPDPLGDWDAEREGDALRSLFPEGFEARPMPSAEMPSAEMPSAEMPSAEAGPGGRWRTGQRLAFEVRLRPVIRYGATRRAGRAEAGRRGGGERDAFLAALEARDEARDASGGDEDTAPLERETVYRDWLARRLEPAASLVEARLVSHRRVTCVRASSRGPGGQRNRARLAGPETLMAGTLAIADTAAFDAALARGIGRHVAFGYGMLLLRPGG